MVHKQSDAVSPKVADVLDKVMSQDTPSQPSSSPQQQRQHSHRSSPILTPTPASPSRPSTPPPSEKLRPVTSMVTSTPVHEDAPRSEVRYSGYRSELNDSLDKSGPEDEGDYSDEQYGARSPGCGSGTYTNDSYSDRRLNYDNSMSPDKDDGENRRSPGGPPPFPPSPYRHFPASSVAVFNSAISGYPPDFARMRFRAYDQMASTESTTSVTYSYGTPPKDSHPDRYPYERDGGAESPGYRSGSDRERGPQFSPSHDRYSRYSSREDAGDSMKLNRSFSPKREGSSPNDTSFLNSTDNMSNASRSPKSLYPHSPGNGGVFPRDSPMGYRHPEMLSPSSAGKMRPVFEGGLPHMPLPPRFGESGMPLPHPQPPPSAVDGKTHVFFCHLCSYSGPTKEEFDAHMSIHFEYNCPHCDYTSRTEGRLKRHIKDFHTDPENKQRTMPGRPKIFRCKQCEFSCINKVEFWAHARTHIKEDKLLQCPRCPFVTEYKHHLEYHLRNHFGSKPFKCTKCNYSCVNKSMLNSHMKSHTNVYQYRCADCTYATKYCHSLKLHLRKYGHKPATVLNSDGSLPQGIDAEISGLSLLAKRGPPRGPRGLRGKDKDGGMGDAFLPPTMCPPLYMTPGDMSPMNPLLNRGIMPGPYWQMIANSMHPPPPLIPVTGMGGPRHPFLPGFEKLNGLGHNFGPDPERDAGGSERDSSSAIKCNMCSYSAETIDSLEAHVLKVHAAENRDLLSVLPFNITSESLLEEQAQRMQARRMSAPPGQTGGVPVSSAHAPSGQDTSPDAYLRRHTMPGAESSPLRVHTKQIISELIKSNPSWPRSMHGGELNGERPFPGSFYRSNGRDRDREQEADMRDAPQEGADILRQMTLKFGASVPASSPSRPPLPVPPASLAVASVPSPLHGALDLTKPRSLTSPYIQSPPPVALMAALPHGALPETLKRKLSGEANSSEDNSCPGDVLMVNSRKRSRKGKAYKLDALCLKLHEKHTVSPYDSDCEDSPPPPEAARSGETKVDKKDEDEYDDYSDRRVERSVGTEHPGRTAELERLHRENSDMDAGEQEENTSMMDSEFEQLQKNLQILNSDAQSADACGHNMPEKFSLRQPSRLDETTLNKGKQSPEKSPMTRDAVDDSSPLPLTREDSHEPEDSIKDRASIISAIYQSQHDAVPPAVRRGTELALKIFKETTSRTSPTNGKTTEPDLPLPIPPPSVLAPSPKNGMSHGLHKIALSKQPLNGCGPSRSPVTLLPARMSTHAQTQPPAAAKIMEEMGLASKLMPPSPRKEVFECPYCDISFRNGVMFSMHMGYHGSPNPYKCNICGQISRDSVDFFLHIARNAHT